MLNLDSAAALAGLDSSNYLSLIDSYSAQLDAGWRLAAGLPLPAGAERADLVLLAAVGDAALAADIARHCVLFRSRLPVVLWQDSSLPAFIGPRTFVVVVASGDDLTAAEFRNLVDSSPDWQQQLRQPRVRVDELKQANHTFSRREWREQVERWTINWVRE